MSQNRLLGLAFNKYEVYLGETTSCDAHWERGKLTASYTIGRKLACLFPCFYFPIPVYLVVVSTVGNFDIGDFIPAHMQKRKALELIPYAIKTLKYNREIGRFMLTRLYDLYVGSFNPAEYKIDLTKASKIAKLSVQVSLSYEIC